MLEQGPAANRLYGGRMNENRHQQVCFSSYFLNKLGYNLLDLHFCFQIYKKKCLHFCL